MLAAYLRERAAAALGVPAAAISGAAADRPGARLAGGGGAQGERRGGARRRRCRCDLLQGIGRRGAGGALLAALAAAGRTCRRCARPAAPLGRDQPLSVGPAGALVPPAAGARGRRPTTSPWRRAPEGSTRRPSRAPSPRWRPATRRCARSSRWWATSRCSGCCPSAAPDVAVEDAAGWSEAARGPPGRGGLAAVRPGDAGRCCGRGSSAGRSEERCCCSPSTTSWPTSRRWR